MDSSPRVSSEERLRAELGEANAEIARLRAEVQIERDNLDRVFNSTPSATAIWSGEELIFERVNDAYQALFPGRPLVGIPFEQALPANVTRDYPERFREVLRTGQPFSIQEQYTPAQLVEGGPFEDRWYNVNFVQLKNRDGSAYGIYQHTVDITEQVQARKRVEAVCGEWDRFRIEQVLTDLLTNAQKYGNGKPVEVTFAAEARHARVSVRDRGIGISIEDQTRIFKPYERAVSSVNISGLGPGLFIASQIVEAHAGQIEVRSVVGEGSTFVVLLPRPA